MDVVENFYDEDDAPAPSNIKEFFSGKTVFITGATGFLGKLLVEKLLRSCTDLRKIYLLVRAKKDKSCQQRFEEYFDNIIFDLLRRKHPKALSKAAMVEGDCGLPNLGLNENDEQILISEVNCFFHMAATVNFVENIRTATNINVRGTRDILKLAQKVESLASFVYTSTAFSFCPQKKIEEKFYKPKITGEQLLNLVESFSDEELEKLAPTLLGEWPNTYTFTKSIAEDLVRREGSDLPVAVVRPSIVIATAKEPLAGWTNNFYGLNGIVAGAFLGLLQTYHCNPNHILDTVPADYVINCCIAAAWEAANTKRLWLSKAVLNLDENVNSEGYKDTISVYNYVSSPVKPLVIKHGLALTHEVGYNIPPARQFWHHCFKPNSNRYLHLLYHYVLQMLPAYVADFFARCTGNKPQLVKIQKKISKFMEVNLFFAHKQWLFSNENTQNLWRKLSSEDKKQFNFDMVALDWKSYFYTYIPGIRVYLIKDPMNTVPQGRAKAFKLKIAHYTLVTIFVLGFLRLLLCLYSVVF